MSAHDILNNPINIGDVVIIPKSDELGVLSGIVLKLTPKQARVAFDAFQGTGYSTHHFREKPVFHECMVVTTDPVIVAASEAIRTHAVSMGWIE